MLGWFFFFFPNVAFLSQECKRVCEHRWEESFLTSCIVICAFPHARVCVHRLVGTTTTTTTTTTTITWYYDISKERAPDAYSSREIQLKLMLIPHRFFYNLTKILAYNGVSSERKFSERSFCILSMTLYRLKWLVGAKFIAARVKGNSGATS